MRKLPWILFCFLILLSGCNKIELPGKKSKGGNPKDTTKIKPPVVDPDTNFDTLTVAQVQNCPDDALLYVRGYIVGFVAGTTLSKAVFGLPAAEDKNTNILLADTPEETDVTRCLPIKLKPDVRGGLSLKDHPEHYKRRFVIKGLTGQYFKCKGLLDVYEFYATSFVDKPSGGDDPGTNPGGEKPGGGGAETPNVDTNPAVVHEGRSIKQKER